IVPAFQRYIRATTLSRPQRKARAPHPGRARFEGSRMGFPTRSSRYVLRELLLLVIAVAAAFVFINHDNLYLNHPFRLADARIESYLLASVVIYLFLRVAIIALEMRPPRPADGLLRCPECGQWIDGRSAGTSSAESDEDEQFLEDSIGESPDEPVARHIRRHVQFAQDCRDQRLALSRRQRRQGDPEDGGHLGPRARFERRGRDRHER